MYEQFYGFNAKPFQLRPDPSFFFNSKGHRRAASYLEYGLSQEEGFIVITGEIGAGKTTLLRNLFCKLPAKNIVAAQIVNTRLDSDDTLRMVAAGFGLPYEDVPKATLLARIEQFLCECNRQGKRALLLIDEAQNLTQNSVEELRMLSNYQTDDKCLLQTFLLGQPEFRTTLLGGGMKQLQQRVIATYHLGPMDSQETRLYIEHRLHTVGWNGDPGFSEDAYSAIYEFTGGIPRKINTLCDRLLLMGYLEEIHSFDKSDVNEVISDIQQEFVLPPARSISIIPGNDTQIDPTTETAASLGNMDERITRMEQSVISVLDLLKRILSLSSVKSITNQSK